MAQSKKPRKKYNAQKITNYCRFNSQDVALLMREPLIAMQAIKEGHILGFESKAYVQLQAMIMHASKVAQYRGMDFDCQPAIKTINKIEHGMKVSDIDIQRLEACALDCRRVFLHSTLAHNEQAEVDLRIYIESHGGRYVGWGVGKS